MGFNYLEVGFFRIIIAFLILVPFVGSGSECVAAKKLKRHFFGYELNSQYIKIADKRLEAIE